MAKRLGLIETQEYNRKMDASTAVLALSVVKRTSSLAVSGTMAFTLPAPRFINQMKVVYTQSAASTPVATLAVASCNGASGAAATRTFSGFGTISASAPKSLTLESLDGLTWTIVSMVGVTVA